jgi:hypothetical protein
MNTCELTAKIEDYTKECAVRSQGAALQNCCIWVQAAERVGRSPVYQVNYSDEAKKWFMDIGGQIWYLDDLGGQVATANDRALTAETLSDATRYEDELFALLPATITLTRKED